MSFDSTRPSAITHVKYHPTLTNASDHNTTHPRKNESNKANHQRTNPTNTKTRPRAQASNLLYKKRIYFTDANVPEALKCVFPFLCLCIICFTLCVMGGGTFYLRLSGDGS